MCGEFVGTVLFLYFALSGTQVANTIPSTGGTTVAQTGSNPQQLQYVALCFGFSLAVNAWVFFRISGGLFNPAVSWRQRSILQTNRTHSGDRSHSACVSLEHSRGSAAAFSSSHKYWVGLRLLRLSLACSLANSTCGLRLVETQPSRKGSSSRCS